MRLSFISVSVNAALGIGCYSIQNLPLGLKILDQAGDDLGCCLGSHLWRGA